MEEKTKPKWGVTAAISEAPPTEKDNKLNDELIETLTNENVFETPEGNATRLKVLEHIQTVLEEFVRRTGAKKGIKTEGGGKMFFFGSYALGVHAPTSDIDTLLCVPKHVYIEDFFRDFPDTFRELSKKDEITELVPVPDAFVPIVKLKYRGVSLDVLFASIPNKTTIPNDMETIDKDVLRHLEETTIRSVNGTRVVKELLASVPQPRHFRYALRAIKLWANRRLCSVPVPIALIRCQVVLYMVQSLAILEALLGPSWSLASANCTQWHAAPPSSPSSSTSCTSGTGRGLLC